MKRNKAKGFGSNSVKAKAVQMVKEVKAGNYQAYSEWLQQCQLRNTLAEIADGEFYTGD
ncbi:MAG: hypothetical protein AAGE84_17090 [Cyanobacteria bacterium P01_G01_bin.39]